MNQRHPLDELFNQHLRNASAPVPEDMWNNRDVVLAWIKRGGRVLESFERTLARDRELALALAEFNWSEFHKVGDTLVRDKAFMIQAVQRDGRVLRFAKYVTIFGECLIGLCFFYVISPQTL